MDWWRIAHVLSLIWLGMGLGATYPLIIKAWATKDVKYQMYCLTEAADNETRILLPGAMATGITGFGWAVSQNYNFVHDGWLLALSLHLGRGSTPAGDPKGAFVDDRALQGSSVAQPTSGARDHYEAGQTRRGGHGTDVCHEVTYPVETVWFTSRPSATRKCGRECECKSVDRSLGPFPPMRE